MTWYLTKIVYRIICGNGTHRPQFDEQLRLVKAGSKREAYKKARQIGIEEQVSFTNEKAQLVHWRFIDVPEVYQLHEVVDGTEIYSRIDEKDHADAYEAVVRKKAEHLLMEAETQDFFHNCDLT